MSHAYRRTVLTLGLVLALGGLLGCQPTAAPVPAAGAGPPRAAPGESSRLIAQPTTAPAAADAPAAPQPLQRVNIAVSSRSATNLPQLVALENGIFTRWGFEVEVQQMRSSIAPAALMSNQIDYFTGLDSSMRAAIAGMPIKVVGVSFKAPAFGLTVKPEIQSIADLRGRVDGVSAQAGAGYYSMKRLLEAHGMTMSDIQVLVVGDSPVQLQQLTLGNIDFANMSAPFIFEALDRGFRMLAYVPDHVSLAMTGLIVSDETLATRRDEVRRMIAATTEANRFVHANRDAAVEAMAKYLDVPVEHAAKAYDFALPTVATDPRISLAEVQTTIQEEVEAGHVQTPPAPEAIVAFDVIEEALTLLR
jgi:NitT/TauT family transport system substrate-binding protein